MAKVQPRDMSKIPMMHVRIVKEGAIVFNPSTGRRLTFWADEPKKKRAFHRVPRAPYWHRRIKDGTLALCDDAGKPIDVAGAKAARDAESKVPDMSGKKTDDKNTGTKAGS